MRRAILGVAVALALAFTAGPGRCGSTDLSVRPGQGFPDLAFDGLLSSEDYAALGLPAQAGPFRLSEIPGEVLVLEFFNRYCLTCWRQALQIESFGKLLGPVDLGRRVRVLSVGSGNTPEELRRFRAEQRVAYPMASDPFFDRYNDLGEPGGTPFTAFLVKRDGAWVLADFHVGFYGDVELLARVRVLLRQPASAELPLAAVPPAAEPADVPLERLRSFLSRVAGEPVSLDPVTLADGAMIYRAVSADGKPQDLFARAAVRQPLCDLCHPIHFLFAFDAEGVARAFEPIHVTKFGNEAWSEQDISRFSSRLAGRRMEEVAFDPEVDAVTSATMSSALIYDELRRTAARLRAAPAGTP